MSQEISQQCSLDNCRKAAKQKLILCPNPSHTNPQFVALLCHARSPRAALLPEDRPYLDQLGHSFQISRAAFLNTTHPLLWLSTSIYPVYFFLILHTWVRQLLCQTPPFRPAHSLSRSDWAVFCGNSHPFNDHNVLVHIAWARVFHAVLLHDHPQPQRFPIPLNQDPVPQQRTTT